jgi:hypothetical protein
MAARIEIIIISELAATDLRSCWWALLAKEEPRKRD